MVAFNQVAQGRDAADLDVFAVVAAPLTVAQRAMALRFCRDRLAIPTTVADEHLAAIADVRRLIVERLAAQCGVALRRS
jgi:hypothetical protein